MEYQLRVVQTGQGAREFLPRDGPENGVMSSAGVEDIDRAPADFDGSFPSMK